MSLIVKNFYLNKNLIILILNLLVLVIFEKTYSYTNGFFIKFEEFIKKKTKKIEFISHLYNFITFIL